MYDLSVTFNLVFFVACVALCVVWLFFAIDAIAAKEPKKPLEVVCLTLGIVGLVIGILSALLSVGFMTGLVTIEGTSVVIASLKIPALARLCSMFTYYITYAFVALFLLLSILLVVFARKKGKAGEESELAAASSEPFEREETPSESLKGDTAQAAAESRDMKISDVRSLMDEISGLVDSCEISLDDENTPPDEESGYEPSGEEYLDENTADDDYYEEEITAETAEPEEPVAESEETPEPDEEPEEEFEEEPETAEEYFTPVNYDETDGDEPAEEPISETVEPIDEDPDEEMTAEEEPEQEPETADEESVREPQDEEVEAVAAAEPVRTDFKRRAAMREIDDFKEVGQRAEQSASGAKSDDTAREARPTQTGLPMKKRHVLINRRNVVNMFSEYLKSKSEEEKARIESSINTIIIK